MNRTPANRTLLGIAIALACTAFLAGTASADTGGVGAPTATTAQAGKGAGARKAVKSNAAQGTQIATWFGPGFYGQQTACGQTMTKAIVGVASRTLPCGTLVLIAYKGRHLTVPVIDRGPYAHNGASWDLTWGAASALGIEDTVRIRTKIVGLAPNSPQLGVPAPSALEAASGGTAAG